jgi:DNA-binding NarL/FixJ family response regulator
MGAFANEVVRIPKDVLLPAAVPHAAYSVNQSELTPKELEVLRLLADGLTTKVIAERLNITFKTASCHRWRILQKLRVDTTVSAVRWAIRVGFVDA